MKAKYVGLPAGVGVFLLLVPVLASCQVAHGKVFVLTNGGRVVGELVNPDQSPRETYVIKTHSGGRVTLARSQVKQVLRQSPELIEYQKTRGDYPDTVEGHWALAEWCRQQKLPAQRKTHLERIIELDPDHATARAGLGFHQRGDQWVTQAEEMAKRGERLYKGRFRTEQEIDLMQDARKKEAAEDAWSRKLKLWRRWLGDNRVRQAQEHILAIKDPMAVKALAFAMKDDGRVPARVLYARALAKIGTTGAMRALAYWALNDPIEEVRLSCLDELEKQKNPDVVGYFVGGLRSKDNGMVRRAAVALRRMRDRSAIRPLIEALWTTHKFKTRGNPGQMSSTFSRGGGGGGSGLSMGGRPKVYTVPIKNQPVLNALESLTDVNFGFDQVTWRAWYASLNRNVSVDVNPRRD